MKKLAAILLLLSVTFVEAQPSYWFSQLQSKTSPQQAQQFWFVPGQGIFFTYQTNRVIISSTGGGGGGTNFTAGPNITFTYLGGNVYQISTGGPYDALGAAHDATNGFPWLVLSDPVGAGTTAAHDATNNLTIPATRLTGLASGTNVTFTTNAGVLTINSSGGGGGAGSGLTTNINLYFADGTLNALVFSNGSLVNIVFPVSPQVAAWNSRVVAHGGASTSDNTQLALTAFLHSLTNASIDTKMLTVNPVVPDNLIASLTPLIIGMGSDPWVNHNFVSGDLTVNGLAGNGSTKYAETGVAGNVFASANSAGVTVYYGTYVNEAAVELATVDGSADQFGLYLYSGVIYFDCFRTTSGAEISAALTTAGYVSGNRIAANSFDIYYASSGSAHASLVHGTAGPITMPTTQLYAWAFNGNGTPMLYTSKRISFVAIHNGLTTSESLAFFQAIQALRTALGGGAI